jgi:hypothetical protein
VGELGKHFFQAQDHYFTQKKLKNIKKKLKFLHAFANLWDSGKSAALELGP